MKISYLSTIFFCAILIFSIYSIPNNYGQSAFAHQSPSHEACWDTKFNLIYLILSITNTVVVLAMWGLAYLSLAIPFVGAAIAAAIFSAIPGVNTVFFALKLLSAPAGYALAISQCEPMIVPPPVTEAGTVHLDCNDNEGFSFTTISNPKIEGPLEPDTEHFYRPTIESESVDRELPLVWVYSLTGALLSIVMPFVLAILIELASLLVGKPPTEAKILSEGFFKQLLKGKFLKTLLTVLFSFAIKAGKSPGFGLLSWFENANTNLSEDAFTLHAFDPIEDAGVRSSTTKFELGKNTVTYFSKSQSFDLEDTATFPFNVYDSEAPHIVFSPKNVTLEANAHYGFKVTSKSLPLVKLGSKAVDNCDPKPNLDYIGPDFYLLTKLKKDQYAPWKTTDHPPASGYYALSPQDMQRVIETEITSFTEDDYQPIRIAGIDPTQTVEFSNLNPEFSTARHLFSLAVNSEINELISNNTKKVPPTADLILSSGLIDSVTLDEIGILGSPTLEEGTTTELDGDDPLRIDTVDQTLLDSLIELSTPGKDSGDATLFGNIFGSGYDSFFYGDTRPNRITGTEVANPNVFVDYQFVTVVDTIAPNVLVTEDIAIEVNSTHPGNTFHPNVNSCSGISPNILCDLTIRPPAIFDIADPFPEIYQNITNADSSHEFEKLETPDLSTTFPLGVSYIGWKAIDFSGNGNQTSDIITQIVNIKLNGTNIVSEANPINATVFSTVPQQINLVVNNTDKDPLKFTIEQDPEKGVIDTPIDAVFLTKFQLEGFVSKLTGITNDFLSDNSVFFTDFLNKRVLMIDDSANLERSFEIPQTTRPEGISITGYDTFMIGDWKQNKIFEINDTGDTINEFDISGLFEDSDIINKKMLSVDPSSKDIYVTDSLAGSITKLVDFDIFDSPKGIEIDPSDSDKVYVADTANNIVHLFNSSGIFIDSLTNDFSNPTDVTVNSNGNILVLDTGNNKIQKFDSGFDLLNEFGPRNNGPDYFDSPQGIALSGNEIFVADTNNHQIKKITSFASIVENYDDDNSWVQIGNQIVIDSDNSLVEFNNTTDTGIGLPYLNYTSKDLGIEEDFWSAEFTLGIDPPQKDSSPVFLWLITNDTKHPQEPSPQDALGVKFHNDTVWIYESHNNSNSTSSEFIDNLKKNKTYIIILEKLASDLASMVVYEDSKDNPPIGNVTHSISTGIDNLTVLQHANDITDDSDNPNLTITQTIINPIVAWLGMCTSGPNCDTLTSSSQGFSCTDASCYGTGPGIQDSQFTNPKGISANTTHIFVADNHRVQIFTKDGIHSKTLGGSNSGSGDDDFDMPNDIEAASDGRIFVADTGNNRTKIYDDNGDLVDIIEGPEGFGNFTSPSGLGVDPSGNTYVSDTGNHRLVKFDSSEDFIDLWKSSINSRIEGYKEVYELYEPEIQAGALDIKEGKVFIGDWNPGDEKIIVSNSTGGKIIKLDISSLTVNPNSIAVKSANEIFVTDPPSNNILVLDSDGNLDGSIDVSDISGFEISPTGITWESEAIEFSIGSTPVEFQNNLLYVFDNNTEGIYAIPDDGSEASLAFDAKDLFSNLNDIAVNATHVFGLDTSPDLSKIIQIRWDKGIKDTFEVENVSGITIGKNMESDSIFYATDNPDSALFKLNRTDNSVSQLIDLDNHGVEGSGIAINPVISQLVSVPISHDSSYDLVGPRGLTFNPENKTMYVSSFVTNEIKVLNSTNFDFVTNILSPGLLQNPTDITIGPNGTLLIASSTNHKILEFNFTSSEMDILADGNDGIVSPSGMTVSPSERHLFVSNGYDNTIKKVNLFTISSTVLKDPDTGEPIGTVNIPSPLEYKGMVFDFVNDTNKGNLQNPQYLTFGPDNNLYVSSFDSNEILSWNPNGEYLGVFGDASINGDSKLERPTGIKFSPDNQFMFVSSAATNKILKFDANTGDYIGIFSDEQTYAPDGLAFGPDGSLFVSSVGSNEVLEYGDSDVKFYVSDWGGVDEIFSFSETGDLIATTNIDHLGLTNPGNIATDKDGRLWISDEGTPSRLVKLNVVANEKAGPDIITEDLVENKAPDLTQTGPSTWVDADGNVYDEFISDVVTSVTPQGISLDNNDNLYLSDWSNNRIVVLDNIGNFLGQVRLNSTFTDPIDIGINQTSSAKLDDIWIFDEHFGQEDQQLLISLDVDEQFKVLEFTDELSPLLRGLTTNGTSLVTTPLNSGSLLDIDESKSAKFDSRHFIIPLGIDLTNSEIFVTDWKEQRIVQLDKSGNFEQEFDFKKVGFPTPEQGDIEVNPVSEFFWITEPRRATIDQIFFNGSAISFPSVADKYVFMSAIDADKQDNFYVISNENSTIAKYDIRGTLLADASDHGFDVGQDIMVDISLAPDSESVFLALSGIQNKVTKFNSTTLEELDSKEIDIIPTSVAIDNDGFVYVSNSSLTVTKLNSNLNKDSTFTIPSLISGGSIADLVMDSKNNLYAVDRVLDRVYKYNLTDNSFVGWLGKCTSSTGNQCDVDSLHSKGFVCDDVSCSNSDGKSFGRDVSQFFEPSQLTVDGLNNVYVADVKLSRDNVAIDDPFVDFEDVFNRGNVPRIQKFTQNGYFVEHVISDTNQTLVRGNFEWVKGIAYGTNHFYVADIEKLHVFDVNPFFDIFTNATSNTTTAKITYESFTDLGLEETDKDSFLYKVFDGFADSNVALVNVTINNPDPDDDGIFGDIDTSPLTPSEIFSSPIDGTNGFIVSRGDQDLTIREDRDVEKGVYIQADIRSGDTEAIIKFCDDLAQVVLKPGNRLTATCTMGGDNGTEAVGIELEIIRGKIDVTFYDREGRSSTSKIISENTIHFSPDPFEFITPENNLDIINQTVHYNGIDYSYLVPKDSKVRIDTASPILPKSDCTTPLTLEAETIHGVDWTDDSTTNQYEEIIEWLTFNATDVDNGSPIETEGDEIMVTNNATNLFVFTGGSQPTPTVVEFFAVDKIGNNSTCTNIVNVRDTIDPVLIFEPAFTEIYNMTGKSSEVGNAFFELPIIYDLPEVLNGDKLEVENRKSICSPISGSEFKIGDTTVICGGTDLSENSDSVEFTVTISPNPESLSIKNVTATGKSPGLNDGDQILVEFTVPTNQPSVGATAQLETLFSLNNGALGTAASGKFIDPSNLLITINDSTSADLIPGITEFDLKSTEDYELLQSASHVLNSTGFNKISNPITLTGDFSSPLAPYITSFAVSDPDSSSPGDYEYSVGDEFTIRFSEPTNAPGKGNVLSKSEVDGLFDFSPYELGDDYVGTWKNRSTFIVIVTKLLTGDISKEPTLGSTQAKVIGDIKNRAGSSFTSTSVSPFLSGSFGQLTSIRDISENSSFVQNLPSGLELVILFPIIDTTNSFTLDDTPILVNMNGTTVFLQKSLIDLSRVIQISEALDVTISSPTTDCQLGCEISFYIHSSDLDERFLRITDEIKILHDKNDDGIAQAEEFITPVIEKLTANTYKVSITIDSFSAISLVALHPKGSSGGDETSPTIQGASLGSGGSMVPLDEIHFENSVEKSTIAVGEEYKIKLTLYENSGPDALQHISLYTDLRGFEREVHHSEAYIRYDKGIGVSDYDPQNLFRETDISILKNGANLEIEFTIIFDKPMEESDLIVRAWDDKRNSVDARFANAIEVIPDDQAGFLEPPIDESTADTGNILIDKETFEKWAGFSGESLSDSEILAKMGIEGKSIPDWYKQIVVKWIQDGSVSYDDFVNAMKFFKKRGLLEN